MFVIFISDVNLFATRDGMGRTVETSVLALMEATVTMLLARVTVLLDGRYLFVTVHK